MDIFKLVGYGLIGYAIYQKLVEVNRPFSETGLAYTTQPWTNPKTGETWQGEVVTVDSVEDRIEQIANLIDEGKEDVSIRQLTTDLIRRGQVRERDYQGELGAVFKYVRSNVRYIHDPHELDTYQRARRTVEMKAGDCDDMTILIGAMTQTIGYPLRLKVVAFEGDEYEHIYPLAGVPPASPRRWISMDATVKNPLGWEVPRSEVSASKVFELFEL